MSQHPKTNEVISDANVSAAVSANLETGAVELQFELTDEETRTHARVGFEMPDLGEAEVFAYKILDAVAEISAARKAVVAVAVPAPDGVG